MHNNHEEAQVSKKLPDFAYDDTRKEAKEKEDSRDYNQGQDAEMRAPESLSGLRRQAQFLEKKNHELRALVERLTHQNEDLWNKVKFGQNMIDKLLRCLAEINRG